MREIKFRTWVRESKDRFRMEYGCPLELSEHESTDYMDDLKKFTYIGASLCQPRNGAIVAIMQFTGLKDKNGKEIYEGDIVSINPKYSPSIIEYDVEMTRFSLSPGYLGEAEGGWKDEGLSVIGNIYENPDLLKEKKQ